MFNTGMVHDGNIRAAFFQQVRHNPDGERVRGGKMGVGGVQCGLKEDEVSLLNPGAVVRRSDERVTDAGG